MSTRALRRLRESRGITVLGGGFGGFGGFGGGFVGAEDGGEIDDDDVDASSAVVPPRRRGTGRRRGGPRAGAATTTTTLEEGEEEEEESDNGAEAELGGEGEDAAGTDEAEGSDGRGTRPSAFLLHAGDSDSDSDTDTDNDDEDSASSSSPNNSNGPDAGACDEEDRNRGRVDHDDDDDDDDAAPEEEAASDRDGASQRRPPLPPSLIPPRPAEKERRNAAKGRVEKVNADDDDDDDLDAILEEFQSRDVGGGNSGIDKGSGAGEEADAAAAAAAAAAAPPPSVSSRSLASVSRTLLEGLDWSDLDVERARSAAMFAPRGVAAAAAAGTRNHNSAIDGGEGGEGQNKNRSRRKGGAANNALMFGNPEPSWNRHSPPTHVGGGIGVATHHDLILRSSNVAGGGGADATEQSSRPLPWPYCDANLIARQEMHVEDKGVEGGVVVVGGANASLVDCLDRKRWYTFQSSDAYRRDLADYRDVIERSGDVTSLLLFVVHHPYCVPALLQASAILEQAGRPRHALSMLKRALWVLESAWQWSASRQIRTGRAVFMDGSDDTTTVRSNNNVDDGLNASFFRALQALIRASSRAGLPQTCWACCRLLLSLDPLRDPTGALLQLDHYCLASNLSAADEWLVRFVQANDRSTIDGPTSGASTPEAGDSDVPIRIWYRDEQDPRIVYSGSLLDMPNVVYSYALALWRLSSDQNHPTEIKAQADAAMQSAIMRFPSVVLLLLEANEVDTRGRSVRRDWPSVLDFCVDYDRAVRYQWRTAARTSTATDRRGVLPLLTGGDDAIVRAATEQAVDHVSRIYARLNASLWSDEGAMQFLYDNLKKVQQDHQHCQVPDGPLPSPALMRYAAFAESDYDDRVQLLPPDAEVVDAELLEEAMRIDPNRRRLIRRPNRRRGGGGDGDGAWDDPDHEWLGAGVDGRRAPHWLGGPPTGVVDPDWPLVEVLWRSFLPWNRVEGVVPPRR